MLKTVVTPHILDPSSELGKWWEMVKKNFVSCWLTLTYVFLQKCFAIYEEQNYLQA